MIRKRLFLSAATAAIAFVSLCPNAFAKTLTEYEADVNAQKAVVAEKQTLADVAQAEFNEYARWMYKNAAESSLFALIESNDFTSVLNNINYIEAIGETYVRKLEVANAAVDEAQAAQDYLETLEKEKEMRVARLEDSKKIQFPQSGMSWSGLSYWGSTVSYAGCGLCSYTVMVDVLTGENYTPADMLEIRGDWVGMDGYPDDKSGSHGKTHRQWTLDRFDIDSWTISTSLETLKNEVKDPEKCAILVAEGNAFKNKSGTWRWSSGHFVCVIGYDSEGFHVADSAYRSEEGTDVVYSDSEMQQMLSCTKHLVIYSN